MKKLTKKEAEEMILECGSYNGITKVFLRDLESLSVGDYVLCEQEEYNFKTELSSIVRNACRVNKFFGKKGIVFKAVKINRDGKGKSWIFTRIK